MSRVVVESHPGHRYIGQLNSGDDLLQGLLSVCRNLDLRCATVRATGVLNEVSLVNYDPGGRAMGTPRTFRTPVMLLSGEGVLAERRAGAALGHPHRVHDVLDTGTPARGA